MKTVVSNSIGNNTLKFSIVCDLDIPEEICIKDNSKVYVVGLVVVVTKVKCRIDFENDGSSSCKKK